MTNITNFQRDMVWFEPKLSYTLPAALAIGSGIPWAGPNDVRHIHGFAASDVTTTHNIALESITALAVPMLPPEDEAIPYRIVWDANTSDNSPRFFLFIGYGASTLTDPIESSVYLGDAHMRDICISVRPLDIADPHYGRPLMVGIGFSKTNGAVTIGASLNVQRLVSQPNQFASAVS